MIKRYNRDYTINLLERVKLIIAVLLVNVFITFGQQKELSDYINPLIGASSSEALAGIYHGLGKTFPGAATPFGMVQLSPNTITGGDNGSGYSYEHKTIEGFAFTQMSGVGWFGDLGNFLVMPTTGPLKIVAGKEDGSVKGYRSAYDKGSEKASAGYYGVTLSSYHIHAETTAAPHSGIMRFTFPANNQSRIQIDLAHRVGGTSTLQYIKVIDSHTIEGWMRCTPDGGGWGDGDGKADYTVYFYAEFSKPMTDYGCWSAAIPDTASRKRENVTSPYYLQRVANAAVLQGQNELTGKHIGFYTQFATKDKEAVLLKAGISFTSIDGAKQNLEQEIKDWDFDNIHQQAKQLWDKALSKAVVAGGTEEEKTVFYTALYHSMIDPRTMQDVNNEYIGGDNKIHLNTAFIKRTIFSGWDVFRSQIPLQTIINPSVVNDLINSLVELGDETGKHYLERWELLNAYSGCMIGNPAIPVITDAYMKGIRNFNIAKAYEYAVNTTNIWGNGEKGYTSEPISISRTLEYAFSESCMAKLATALGKEEDAAKYARWSQSYKNVFDEEKGWFRPRDENGNWLPWPKEGRMKQDYGTVESNPYQQGWFVPQDVPGMVKLMGGKDKVLADLQELFEKVPENMMWNDYYNQANEPVHHVPFLFNRLGAPWLTQKWSRAICRRAYHNSVEGLVGNEDVGQMSAWYALAAMGFHPVAAGNTRYELTSPVFSKVTITLDSEYATPGKKFVIIAKNNSPKNIYIQSAKLNGKPYMNCFIDHKQIITGGLLELTMGPTPNKDWGKGSDL